MNVIQKVEHWGDSHRAKWLDVVRIVLGLIIFSKGIALISDTGHQQELLFKNSVFGFSEMMSSIAIHLVAFAHLVGGILITIGLVTRFAVVIQIPILVCAVLFVNISNGFSALNSELWLSLIVLCLLVLFWVVGSGPFSVDHQIKYKRV
ncbi:DoxX family protein [Pedobacter sp. ASV12]|uniref:DoxX family protein n=1 Tax=Pedobacter sp. ASV12 TaxID=2795120 RepID=UPI0018EB3F65|nr:DoxX family protein [Pedobacter sp. ASV12]